MDICLTKDSDKLICLMYKSYLEKVKAKVPKSQAKYFESSAEIHSQLVPDWLFEDVDETCRELSRAGLLNVVYASDIASDVMLSDKAVIYMENRFKDGLKGIASFIAQFIP